MGHYFLDIRYTVCPRSLDPFYIESYYDVDFWIFRKVCSRSSGPFYIVSYYVKLVAPFWTYCSYAYVNLWSFAPFYMVTYSVMLIRIHMSDSESRSRGIKYMMVYIQGCLFFITCERKNFYLFCNFLFVLSLNCNNLIESFLIL